MGEELPFVGITTFCKVPCTRGLSGVDVAVIGAPLDPETTNRTGTRYGPRAIREPPRSMVPSFNPNREYTTSNSEDTSSQAQKSLTMAMCPWRRR